jgi:hypothetical protein
MPLIACLLRHGAARASAWQVNCFIIEITFQIKNMELRKEDLPATLQAFELRDNEEIFLAEQVVNNQAEIELFTTRYSGKLIKAKTIAVDNRTQTSSSPGHQAPERNNNAIIVTVIILVIAALVAYGIYTGWIQQQLDINM